MEKAPKDGLIGPGETRTLGTVMLVFSWELKDTGKYTILTTDMVKGKRFTITIMIKDCNGNILSQKPSLIHLLKNNK